MQNLEVLCCPLVLNLEFQGTQYHPALVFHPWNYLFYFEWSDILILMKCRRVLPHACEPCKKPTDLLT